MHFGFGYSASNYINVDGSSQKHRPLFLYRFISTYTGKKKLSVRLTKPSYFYVCGSVKSESAVRLVKSTQNCD